MALYNTAYLDATARATRTTEVPNASWTTGMNWGGSCAVGIGINADDTTPIAVEGSAEQFTLLDQAGAARTPQNSQQIGGLALGTIAQRPSSGGLEGLGGADGVLLTTDGTGDGDQTSVGDAGLPTLDGWIINV